MAEETLPARWARRWAEAPASPVLHDAGRWVTAAELEERSRTVAGRLAAAGVAPGDRVLISAQPSADLVVAHVAALRLGAVVVPVSPAYGEQELAHVVRGGAPAVAVLDDVSRVAGVPGCRAVTPDVPLPDGPDPMLDVAAPGDPGLLMYTSGTTGPPKAAVLSHGNLLAGADSVRRAWRWTPADRLVLALPLFHVHGLAVGLHGTLLAGASAVLRPRFAVDDVLAAAADHRATMFFGVPTMYARIAASGRADELRSLRLAVSGSAPLSIEVFGAVAAAGTTILERYGMTETLLTVSNPYDGERRPGTVGLPLPGVELRLGAGEEIQVRGPSVTSGYLDRPEATAEAFTAGGWFRTGDLGEFDPAGYLRISGRSKELIITGGYNVHPREVEDVLRAHPGVQDAAVIGVPDADLGERVVAFVEGDASPADLLEFAAARLAPYKRPRAVTTVEALPRNALGKVVKALLG